MANKKDDQKIYFVPSAHAFDTLEQAEEWLERLAEKSQIRKNTRVFETTGKVYTPRLKLIEEKD